MTRGVFLPIILMGLIGTTFAQEKPVSVCQILEHMDDHSGRIVTVRARLYSAESLEADDCSLKLRVGQFDFQNQIAVYWPDSAVVTASRFEVPFSVDLASRSFLWKEIEVRRSLGARLYATVEGLIVTRRPPMALALKANPKVTQGFGHMGLAPAAIIVKRVSEILVVRQEQDSPEDSTPFER